MSKNKFKRDTLTNKTMKGLFWSASGAGFQAFVKIAVLSILARLLSPDEFGIVNAATVVIGFSLLFTQMGIGPALIQFKELRSEHITSGFWISIFAGILMSIIVFLSSSNIASFFHMERLVLVMRVLSVLFILQSFSIVPLSLLQREMKFKKLIIIEIVTYLFGYGLISITLAYLDYGIWALVYGQISQVILSSIILLFYVKFQKQIVLKSRAIKDLFYFGSGFTLAKIGNYFALQGDYIVIGRWLGSVALGIYGRAYQFMVMPVALFGTALDRVMFPAMASVQGDKEKLTITYIRGVSGVSLIAMPISVFIVFFSNEIISVFLGDGWQDAIVPLQILSSALYFRMSYKMSDSIARATGKVYERAWRQMIYAIAVFIGAWLGHFNGLNWVSVGVVTALLINYFLMAHLSFSLIDTSLFFFIKAHKNGFYLAIIIFFSSFFSKMLFAYFELSSLYSLIFGIIIFMSLVFLLQKYFPKVFLGESGIWLINQIKVFLPKKVHFFFA